MVGQTVGLVVKTSDWDVSHRRRLDSELIEASLPEHQTDQDTAYWQLVFVFMPIGDSASMLLAGLSGDPMAVC
jgi:hypothetical protein